MRGLENRFNRCFRELHGGGCLGERRSWLCRDTFHFARRKRRLIRGKDGIFGGFLLGARDLEDGEIDLFLGLGALESPSRLEGFNAAPEQALDHVFGLVGFWKDGCISRHHDRWFRCGGL